MKCLNSYTLFTSLLKINLAQKKFSFDVKLNRTVITFLKLLYHKKVIRRYVKIGVNKYRIFPNWSSLNFSSKKIRFFQKKTPITLSYKSLKFLQKSTFNSMLILNTNKGLITHTEAIKYQVGGHLICLIL